LGREIRHREQAEESFRERLLAAGLIDDDAAAVLDLVRYQLAGRAGDVTPEVERITGRPPFSFQRFARDHAEIFERGFQE
jgi:hypothetical protein